ncbi:MAG: L,D-transpeptidase family protein [Actinobacteria bacterium]|nr:L,D-transpeptidase family protein [Actinomycetota bacterium]
MTGGAMTAFALIALLVSGCTGSGSGSQGSTTTSDAAKITITPADGAKAADPSAGITVTASTGRLTKVTAQAGGVAVPGTLSMDGRTWHSQWALETGQNYTVTATDSANGGRPVTTTSSFTTLTPDQTFRTQIFEGANQSYGVGMPIILTFSKPVTNKAAVEKSLELTTSNPVVGSWYWDGNQTLNFRPRDYWPAGTTVSFTGHLDGVQAAPGVYGTHTLTQTFNIGASVIAVANTTTHRTQIYTDGALKYDWPISSGKPGDDTPNGSYLTIEKANPVRMKGPGYNILVPWSVRFTFSGDYYHDAFWSVNQQGFENVSHGCVNLSPANAETYYKLAVPGDPIIVKGSPRGGTWDNGWTEWFLSWPDFLKGSALHMAVQAGPSGSTFVDPATLPASTASAPLQTAPANNSAAG